MEILEAIEGYDWGEVFGDVEYISNHDAWTFVSLDGSLSLSEIKVNRSEVVKILWIQEGVSDEKDWRILAELKDGQVVFAEGGCDYTGWDCVSNVRRFISDNLESLLMWVITPGERQEIGL